MIVFLNGKFVPEEAATVSIFDRGFLYGDGLFETILVTKGKPFRWDDHISRLEKGAAYLKINVPFSLQTLLDTVLELIQKNNLTEGLLRLTLSRGIGLRGYSPKGASHPTLAMSLTPAPDLLTKQLPQWRAITSSHRLPAEEPLAEFKTSNKLVQILARTEAEAAGADEALLLNSRSELVESASSNLFWTNGDEVCTPPLSSGVLAGVTRKVVLELCETIGLKSRQTAITQKEIHVTDGVFLSVSSMGIIEVTALDGKPLNRSPFTRKLRDAYLELVGTT